MASTFQELLLCLCLAMIITGIFADQQFQYVLAFPKHVKHAIPSLAISPLSQDFVQNIEVTVTAPARKTASGEIRTQEYSHNFSSSSNEQWLLNLEYLVHFEMSGIGKSQGIMVTSTSQLVVRAKSLKVRMAEDFKKSAGAFNVMPTTLLSHEYVVVTECSSSFCFLLVVNPDGSNDVIIELSLQPAQREIIYNNGSTDIILHSGQVLPESLGPLDVLQILGKQTDLTGTWVRAERKVAVITGTDFSCVWIQRDLCSTLDMAVEQLPPVCSLGQSYVFAPFVNSSIKSFVKIGYTSPSTTVFGLDNVLINVNTSQDFPTFFTFQLNGDSIVYLYASAPVLVLQYVVALKHTTFFDSSVTVIYPLSKWRTHAEILPFDDMNLITLIVALCKCIKEIKIGVSVEEFKTRAKREHRYCSRQMIITSSTKLNKIFVNSDECLFSGVVVATHRDKTGWAVPLVTFQPIDDNTTSCELQLTSTEVQKSNMKSLTTAAGTTQATLKSTEEDVTVSSRISETSNDNNGPAFEETSNDNNSLTVEETSNDNGGLTVGESSNDNNDLTIWETTQGTPEATEKDITVLSRIPEASHDNNRQTVEQTSPVTPESTRDNIKFWSRILTVAKDDNKNTVEEISQSPISKIRFILCPCSCLSGSQNYRDLLNETMPFLSSKRAAIQSFLHVPRANLSRRVRSKMCAIDHRPSSTSIGFVVFGCTILPIFGILILNDCYKALRWLLRR
ncbi:uncharacterized protein LOC106011384 [Aplysia californica]|uniref:Uncharacterized protein LOC106011384 n=1 Tax=Aplysia californica TaxID=6500 RepID=A0ABM0ZX02_APLCA|nr:uncharacterized protein LOC106011384 [Aplysia californica]